LQTFIFFFLQIIIKKNNKTVTNGRRGYMLSSISPVIVWLIIFALLIIVELITMGLTTIWFAGGAIIAAIISLFCGPVWLQVVAFAAVSLVLLYFTRPIAVKYFNRNRFRTNVESMIGKQAVVIGEIDNIQGLGQVKVGGMEWSARSVDDSVIRVGTVVEVVNVEGVKLIVKERPEA